MASSWDDLASESAEQVIRASGALALAKLKLRFSAAKLRQQDKDAVDRRIKAVATARMPKERMDVAGAGLCINLMR